MVQTNLPSGVVGADITPSAKLQERKELASLAKGVNILTQSELAARLERDRAAGAGAFREEALQQEADQMRALEEITATFPNQSGAAREEFKYADELSTAPTEAEEVDATPQLSQAQLIEELSKPVFTMQIDETDARNNEKLQELKLHNRLLTKAEALSKNLGVPGMLSYESLLNLSKDLVASGQAGKPLLDALTRVHLAAKKMQQGISLKGSMTKAQRKMFLQTGSWKLSAHAAEDTSQSVSNIIASADPAKRMEGITYKETTQADAPIRSSNPTLNTNMTNIVLDVLEAGYLNNNGQIEIDPELFSIMAMNAEESFITSLYATDQTESLADIVIDEDADTKVPRPKKNDPKAEQDIKVAVIRKTDGLERVGRNIYREYKRMKAVSLGQEPDAYLADIDDINKEVFIHLGSRAKEFYYKAVSAEADPETGLLRRPKGGGLEKDLVEYIVTPYGSSVFEDMYRVYSGLFEATEVKPQPHAVKGGVIAGEGTQITRRMTTWMSEYIGDTTMAFNAMEVQNAIPIVNDSSRSSLSAILYMQALAGGGRVEPIINSATMQPMHARHNIYTEPQNKRNYYADIFKIGRNKFDDLQSEKRSLHERVDQLKRERQAALGAQSQAELANVPSEEEIKMAEAVAENYNPSSILKLEREKSINIAEAIQRYNGVNHLTYALQLLTGRMHAQQTLYNPQAHPMVRNVVSGGHVYSWIPGQGGQIENDFKVLMTAKLFEDPKVSDVYNWKKDKGFRMPEEKRLQVFNELEAESRARPNEGLWNQYVAWGRELIALTQRADKPRIANYLAQIKKNGLQGTSSNPVMEQVRAEFSQDSLSEPLRVWLSEHEQDAIKHADYLMALAKYTDARKAGKTFHATQAFEIDGKTHGPLTMGAQFGSVAMTKRGDMITAVPLIDKLKGDDFMDLRDAMAKTMLDEYARLAQSNSYRSQLGGDKTDALGVILREALQDRENMLKKSPMTLGYGQVVMSLKRHVQKVIDLNPKIRKIAADNKLKVNQVVDWLHNMMVNAIYANMDGHTIDTMNTIKHIAWQSVLLNEMLTFYQPTGLKVYSTGMEYFPDKKVSWDSKSTPDDMDALPKAITDYSYMGKASPQAIRKFPSGGAEIGGFTVSRVLASLIQGYDPDMTQGVFNNVKFTGKDKYGNSEFKTTNYWNQIKEAAFNNGARIKRIKDGKEVYEGNPFVIQIYDAFLVDLGSYSKVKEIANKIHKESIINDDAAYKVFNWYEQAAKPKLEKLSTDTNMYDVEKDFLKIYTLFTGEKYQAKFGNINPYKELVKYLKKNIRMEWNREGTEVQVWNAAKNKMVTERINKQTLKDWDQKIHSKAFKTAIDIEKELTTIETKPLDMLNTTGKLPGTEIARILKVLNKHAGLEPQIIKAKSNTSAGKKEVRKALSTGGPSNNIDA